MSGSAGLSKRSYAVSLTDLTRFRTVGVVPVVPVPKVKRDKFGTILAFDQALAKIGWALLRLSGQERLVLRTGMCKTDPTDKKGFEDSFRRGVFLAQQLRPIVRAVVTPGTEPMFRPDLVAHEMPAAMGSMASRNREGPIVAAMAVRIVADEAGLPLVMMNRQHVYKELGLPARATKREVADYVRSLMPDLGHRGVGPLNEDTFDSIALALVVAESDWL